MVSEDVEALTALFRDVRYGGEAATEDRERRAVDALRAIEDRFSGDEGRARPRNIRVTASRVSVSQDLYCKNCNRLTVDRNVRALIIALLCVLAVSLAAATLVNPQSASGGGSGGGIGVLDPGGAENDTETNSSGDDRNSSLTGEEAFSLQGICIPFLVSPTFLFAAVAALAGLFWVIKRRQSLPYAFAVMFPVLMLLAFPYLLVTNCGSSAQQGGDLMPPLPEGGSDIPSSGTGANPSATDTLLSPPVLLLVLVVVALLLAFFVYRASGGESVEAEEPAPEQQLVEDEPSLAAVGAAAGAAADRIEDAADVDNEVYRAWREMTTHIDVSNPDASTPAEFASAAGDAGMDDAHVDTLTELFRDVRYGGEAATEDRERRAVDALRAIEDRYADGGAD